MQERQSKCMTGELKVSRKMNYHFFTFYVSAIVAKRRIRTVQYQYFKIAIVSLFYCKIILLNKTKTYFTTLMVRILNIYIGRKIWQAKQMG